MSRTLWHAERRIPVPAGDSFFSRGHWATQRALCRPSQSRPVWVPDSRPGVVSISRVRPPARDTRRAGRAAALRVTGPGPAALRSWRLLVGLTAGLAILAAAALYHPSVIVLSPGPALDVVGDIEITGVKTRRPSGRYLLTSVRILRPTAMSALVAALDPSQDVVARSSVVPEGVDPDRFLRDEAETFRQSRLMAAAAAVRAMEMNVTLHGTGAVVRGTVAGTPAARVLRYDDVIVAIGGRRVRFASDVLGLVAARPAGTMLTMTLDRGGLPMTVRVRSAWLGRVAGIGALLDTRAFSADFPFEIRFRGQEVAGPSAGLVYGLAILDMLDPADIAATRSIAATGTLDQDGTVGPVGGVTHKAAGAAAERADVFLVPGERLDEARAPGLRVEGVETLSGALKTLRVSSL